MKRAYKIEISPTDEQKSKIHQTIGVSRFIYNFYIAHNKEVYEKEGKFVSGMDFSKWLNKNNKTDWTLERHRVKIPTLGWIRFKEFGYIPINSVVKSGTVSQKADRYYVSILVEEDDIQVSKPTNEGIGIDVGIKDFAICSDGTKFKNVNKTSTVKKVEKKLKREQRKLSRKYESLKIRNKNIEEGRATRQNIQKQVVKVQKLHQSRT